MAKSARGGKFWKLGISFCWKLGSMDGPTKVSSLYGVGRRGPRIKGKIWWGAIFIFDLFFVAVFLCFVFSHLLFF